MADFAPLSLVHHTRSVHGVRHVAYASYSEFCARKIARARKQLGLVQQRGKRFEKKPVASASNVDVRHLQCLLFESERAWARAMHLKTQLSSRKIANRAKQHMLHRLARAALHASLLSQRAREVTDLSATSLAQIDAYMLTMRGTHAFEMAHWQMAHRLLAAADAVLDAIARRTPDADLQAYAYEAQDDVSPMLRVCRYSLSLTTSTGQPDAYLKDWSAVRDRLEEEAITTGQKAEPVRLRWRDRIEDVRNADLAKAIMKAQKALQVIESGGRKLGTSSRKKLTGVASLAAFDVALGALSDAEDIARHLMDDNQVALDKAHSSRFETATAPLRFAHAYLLTRLLSTRCQRDLLLAADARKAAASVKLFDAALQSFEKLVNIDLLLQDGDAAEAMEAKAVLVRGQRCAHLARAYSSLRQHPKAALLAERAVSYARQAKPGFMPTDDELDDSLRPLALTRKDVEDFEEQAKLVRSQVAQAWFASGPDIDEAKALDSLRLDGKPKRHKPLFFDVAVNYATQPDVDELARRIGKVAPPVDRVIDTVSEPASEVVQATASKARAGGFWGIFGR